MERQWVNIQPDKSHGYEKISSLHVKMTTRFTVSVPAQLFAKECLKIGYTLKHQHTDAGLTS